MKFWKTLSAGTLVLAMVALLINCAHTSSQRKEALQPTAPEGNIKREPGSAAAFQYFWDELKDLAKEYRDTALYNLTEYQRRAAKFMKTAQSTKLSAAKKKQLLAFHIQKARESVALQVQTLPYGVDSAMAYSLNDYIDDIQEKVTGGKFKEASDLAAQYFKTFGEFKNTLSSI